MAYLKLGSDREGDRAPLPPKGWTSEVKKITSNLRALDVKETQSSVLTMQARGRFHATKNQPYKNQLPTKLIGLVNQLIDLGWNVEVKSDV